MQRNTSKQPRRAVQYNKQQSADKKERTASGGAQPKGGGKFLSFLRGWRGTLLVFFVLCWAWAGWYYGSVFHISREYSFWVGDLRIMNFILSQSYGGLRFVGRAMLQLYKYPWLGGLLMALMLTTISWLMGRTLANSFLKWWKPGKKGSLAKEGLIGVLQFLPALVYMAVVTWHGLDIFFEARTGFIFGIPLACLVVLFIWDIFIRSFKSRVKSEELRVKNNNDSLKGETNSDSSFFTLHSSLIIIVLAFAAIIGFDHWKRPYVRVICQLLEMEYEQDWAGIQKLARANAIMSNRPMACSYAIALVQTGQIGERLYDIRLDYDSLHIHGMDGHHNNASGLYVPEGNYYGGFVESSQHACMEQMVMTGPTIRLLKLQTKCALMREEWNLAEKYLAMLKRVPFEGAFCEKYGKMVRRIDLVNAEPEMAKIRLTEPLHDSFEGQYQQPLFMGYNLLLVEGRSKEALINSLSVCLYTKLMPQFVERLEPLVGSTPPSIILDGIMLAENKNPGISQHFTGLQFRQPQLQSFVENTRQYMKDRPGHAYELFPRYKGYYPYYYFFGNLKATKKGYTSLSSSNSGVN